MTAKHGGDPRNEIQASEMKYPKENYRNRIRENRISDAQIREVLKIQSTLDYVESGQVKSWWDHLQEDERNERPVKQVWEAKTQIRRKRGRPRQTDRHGTELYWRNTLRKRKGKRGKAKCVEAKILARNKKKEGIDC